MPKWENFIKINMKIAKNQNNYFYLRSEDKKDFYTNFFKNYGCSIMHKNCYEQMLEHTMKYFNLINEDEIIRFIDFNYEITDDELCYIMDLASKYSDYAYQSVKKLFN